MIRNFSHSRIYRQIVDLLDRSPLPRYELVERTLSRLGLSDEELADRALGSYSNSTRIKVGTVVSEMLATGLVAIDSFGKYYLVSTRPVVIRIEMCEKEIIKALSESPMSKAELRDRMKDVFGTAKTATTKDDDTLSTYMGQVLKKLISFGVIILEDSVYSLSQKVSARADDVNEMLSLRSEFIRRIHARGGEFFENYFMQLLKRHLEKNGIKVLECYVTGGADDGGIDGVAKIEDSLGFRETMLVQTKNRTEIQSEKDLRGFYGAFHAKSGTRGIFATTSDLHPTAAEFVDELDDCVAINGTMIFKIARECAYGIKRSGSKEEIDKKII